MLFAAARMVGFLLSAGAAVAMLAAVTLLPAYAELRRLEHARDSARADLEYGQALVVGYDRLLADLQAGEPVVTARLASRVLGVQPAGAAAAVPLAVAAEHPWLSLPAIERPAAPDDRLLRAAAMIAPARTRRGLLVMAAGAMMIGVLVFAPPEKYRRQAAAAGA